MALLQRLRSALDWLRALALNPYFWGGMGVLLVLGLGVYFVVDGLIMPNYTRHDVAVRVPDVESRSFEQAKSEMQEKGLEVRREVGRYNPNVAEGVVVDQTPLPTTTVKPGRRIYLTVNSGKVPMVKMPDLGGVSVREAENRVSSAGLTVGRVQPDSVPSPYPNTITRQAPPPGDSVRRGTTVDLWYSTGLGNTRVEVPNVVGRTVADARQVLLNQKLRSVVVDTTGSASDSTRGGAAPLQTARQAPQFVRRQGRAPGSRVRTGTQIRLFVTRDPGSIPSPANRDTTGTPTDTSRADTSESVVPEP